MLAEIDPHADYLNAVFARIDRLRQIDVSVLTERFGIDPAALSPIEGETPKSWAVERVLADADAQRVELHEHLAGLTREFVADGLLFDAAVLKAQETLGEPTALATQITRSTSQTALGLDSKWLPFLRHGSALPWVFMFLPYGALALLPFAPAILGTLSILGISCGLTLGYARGISVSPEIRALIGQIVENLSILQELPTRRSLTAQQQIARLAIKRKLSHLKFIHNATSGIVVDKPEMARMVMSEVIYAVLSLALVALMFRVGGIVFAILCARLPYDLFTLSRTVGLNMGIRRSIAQRRAS